MSSTLWNDAELRAYVFRADTGFWEDQSELEAMRERFAASARVRLSAQVRNRVLASAGVSIDATGVVALASEMLRYGWLTDNERTWMAVCDSPWRFLEDCVTKRITKAYRSTVGRASSEKQLTGIAAASSRRALEAPQTE